MISLAEVKRIAKEGDRVLVTVLDQKNGGGFN